MLALRSRFSRMDTRPLNTSNRMNAAQATASEKALASSSAIVTLRESDGLDEETRCPEAARRRVRSTETGEEAVS